jgi:hypothetical protein
MLNKMRNERRCTGHEALLSGRQSRGFSRSKSLSKRSCPDSSKASVSTSSANFGD